MIINKQRIISYKKELDSLIGAEELKRYVNELCALYERIDGINKDNIDILYDRALLLSINEGDGLETWLEVISGIWKLLLDDDYLPVKRYELKLPKLSDVKEMNMASDRDIVLNTIENDYILESFEGRRFLCMDITKWVDDIESPAFRAVLSRLRLSLKDQFVFFRIPAVDEVTFRRVKEAIGWFMNVDGLYCPPYGLDDYLDYGMGRLRKQGIKTEAGVEELFREIIAGEKRDRNFCGFKTVRCLADNMVLSAVFEKHP